MSIARATSHDLEAVINVITTASHSAKGKMEAYAEEKGKPKSAWRSILKIVAKPEFLYYYKNCFLLKGSRGDVLGGIFLLTSYPNSYLSTFSEEAQTRGSSRVRTSGCRWSDGYS